MSISIPPIPEPVAEAYSKLLYRGDRTDSCEKCVHQDGCKDRKIFHRNHPGYAITFCSGYERQQTNADRIRSMTDEELSRFITSIDQDNPCPPDHSCWCTKSNCFDGWLSWLKSPVEVQDGT